MAAALLADMRHEARRPAADRWTSVFFGGGTPSLMPPALVARCSRAERLWGLPRHRDHLEANPSSVEAANFAALAAAGVNRVSLGCRRSTTRRCASSGGCTAREGPAALETAQAAFERVSFDLIYARPGQSPEQWAAELTRALGFGTGHLSLYQLTIEPGTRFATDVRQGAFAPLETTPPPACSR
jgi:oxygen-independent coproporphyrinogen-3 oxidase